MSSAVWTAQWLADACSGSVIADSGGAPTGFAIDSRQVQHGDLFIGIPGARSDGGAFAAQVIEGGAWGALVTPGHSSAAAKADGTVIEHPDPVAALGMIASAHLQELDCKVVGITGSSGKTSTKDILLAVLSTAGNTVATRGNRNTEIGMPLEILRATRETRFLVLEMAMRGRGQIADLAAIAAPDVGVVVTIGPAHLDLLGSMEEIAAAKCELLAGLAPDSVAVVPTAEPLLEPHLRTDIKTVFFGQSGDVDLTAVNGRDLTISLNGSEIEISVNFDQAHNRSNLLAALAAADAIGVRPPRNLSVHFSALRGERIELPRNIMLINDCYNSNPQSLGAGLADLASESKRRGGRAVAVLGDMLELGPNEVEFHREAGAEAESLGVGLLVAVGPLSAHMAAGFKGATVTFPHAEATADALGDLLQPGDTVLVKGSRGIGLDVVAQRLGKEG